MERTPNNADTPVTRSELKAEFGVFKAEMEPLLSDQGNVILEAVDERMDKKLDEKLDAKLNPVIDKLDGIMKGIDDLRQENTIGAEQLRRHEDRITKLETARA